MLSAGMMDASIDAAPADLPLRARVLGTGTGRALAFHAPPTKILSCLHELNTAIVILRRFIAYRLDRSPMLRRHSAHWLSVIAVGRSLIRGGGRRVFGIIAR